MQAATDDTKNSTFSIYLWGAGINGNLQNGSEIDVGFGNILDELDLALMAAYETRILGASFCFLIIFIKCFVIQ